jgi:hypothetical protein
MVKGSDHGQDYSLSFRITTSMGGVHHADILMKVRAAI